MSKSEVAVCAVLWFVWSRTESCRCKQRGKAQFMDKLPAQKERRLVLARSSMVLLSTVHGASDTSDAV